MKYPTGEYRILLCLYQQLQQPEPRMFSRSVREHHVLFLANTSTLKLYFARQGTRWWLINEQPCLGLPAFRYPAGQPGRFFIPSLKNYVCVKLHHLLDNNACALHWFRQAMVREAQRVFDQAVAHHQARPVTPLFRFHQSVRVDSQTLPRQSRILGPDTVRIILTLRQDGLGGMTLDITVHYHPLPFASRQVHLVLAGDLSPQGQAPLATLKTSLCQHIATIADRLFHSS